MNIAVTGGAGFIGSHLVEELIKDGHNVKIIDNLSSGKKSNVPEKAELIRKDIKEDNLCDEFEDLSTVFHFAANPKVNTFPEDRDKDFEENLGGVKNVVDAVCETHVENLIFASSSAVYGENAEIPTSESSEMNPISMYAATKCGGEHICQVYSKTFNFDLTIVRLANIVGGRNRKGVVYDFLQKIKENPEKLTILGNGKQKKSYLHVSDAVSGIMTAWKSDDVIFNIGSEDAIEVDTIADIISDELEEDPEYEYTGGEKGWKGDVPEMRLSIEKLKAEGWNVKNKSRESVRRAVQNQESDSKGSI
ncbi:NAD-dependent epimerase/dehydratase family protein [Candidatus Nanohalococcus occultus]|uniref:UDP-glucose 4-epimerase n=1 Tax=Candidatus Nanohalococcus occultus TaxID=2978047 RepID=A0ABY8CFT5_9ARCH|nr:UDP-glucose 4-epimerase [Candidatus Nanohaloarchaeota archaeon SVXNc]